MPNPFVGTSAALVAALALSMSLASCTRSDDTARNDEPPARTDGPLFIGNAHTTFLPVTNDQVFSDGFEILQIQADTPATLISAQPEGGNETLKFLGARVGLPGRPDDFNQIMPGFPPKAVPAKYQQPLGGTVMEPGKTYMLILGYRVIDADNLGHRTGIDIEYEVAGEKYLAKLPAGLVTCPQALSDKECATAAR
jgi:hypothetical protein